MRWSQDPLSQSKTWHSSVLVPASLGVGIRVEVKNGQKQGCLTNILLTDEVFLLSASICKAGAIMADASPEHFTLFLLFQEGSSGIFVLSSWSPSLHFCKSLLLIMGPLLIPPARRAPAPRQREGYWASS